MVNHNEAIKYPWLPSARDYFPEELAQDVTAWVASIPSKYPDLFEQVYQIIQFAAQRKEIIPNFNPTETHLVLYPFLRIFLSILQNNPLTFQIANTYSKTMNSLLNAENERQLEQFAKDLRWNVIKQDQIILLRKFRYRMRVTDYIKYSVLMKDPNWKCTNKFVMNGFVILDKADLVRIFEEHVKWEIINATHIDVGDLGDVLGKIPAFHDFYEEVLAFAKESQKNFSSTLDLTGIEDKDSLFPPCVRVLYIKAIQGQNLNHIERLFFAFFLLNMDYSVDEVIEIFKNSPDFDEKIARYQIEHAAGERGKGTKYKAHGCGKLQSYGMCYAKDDAVGHPWCEKGEVKHPMSFVKRYLRDRRRKPKQNVDDAKERIVPQGGNQAG